MFDLKAKLQKTRDGFVTPFRKAFQGSARLTAEDEEAIEELLLASDIGIAACERIMSDLRSRPHDSGARDFLQEELLTLLGGAEDARPPAEFPRVNLVVGINGVGKTTSIAKLARHYQNQGRTVLLAAADTFRAAARDQLAVWAGRLGTDMIGHAAGGDPAAVAFDACTAAKSRSVDYVIVDTAGRLHTRVNLMEELKKVKRVCEKVCGPAAVDVYLTLDATLGQNSLHQASEFTRNLDVHGIILTKLDSTAKGGIVVAIKQTLGVPVRFIGAGEGLEDFSVFAPREFVDALLSDKPS